ncbi:DISEASE RESISTANCE PROTEIN RP [Salix purpurea]|uniref:DISEASE RESISTANCE PROTEIN RP n=1 Tax=Salix purpurea TaxID=77065 RepID=A0A9Q1AFY3_SALPP|nr:DISEASE RESISTANCE PROTEIN RP [Salix purpurea]
MFFAWGDGRIHTKISKGLPKLSKLSIYTAQKDFPRVQDLKALRQESNAAVIPYLPEHLVKLDLQCYPETKAPIWLSPGSLENLQKLYIRGGHLSALGRTHDGNDKWNVKILRLKFLKELRMDWRVLHDAFPHLIYLEKFYCPKMTFFPCDGTGAWFDREKLAKPAVGRIRN